LKIDVFPFFLFLCFFLIGDGESNTVIACRFGADLSFHYQWFQKHLPVGERFCRVLPHGCLYIMSKKAVGNDWKKSTILTLRHAAGSGKYAPSNETLLVQKTIQRAKKRTVEQQQQVLL
jgi:hypothetical protein